jgi:hypothetical protein
MTSKFRKGFQMQTIFIRVFAKKINKTNTGSIDSIRSSGVAGFLLTAFSTRQSAQNAGGQFFNTAFLFSRIGYLCAPKAPGHAPDLPGGTFSGWV